MPADPAPGDPRLDAAVQAVRDIVGADGGDVVVAAVEPTAVTLDLILEGAECRECVMPRPFLEQVALDLMTPHLSGLATVTINDPRETDGA